MFIYLITQGLRCMDFIPAFRTKATGKKLSFFSNRMNHTDPFITAEGKEKDHYRLKSDFSSSLSSDSSFLCRCFRTWFIKNKLYFPWFVIKMNTFHIYMLKNESKAITQERWKQGRFKCSLATAHERLVVFLQDFKRAPRFLLEDGRAQETRVRELVPTPQFPDRKERK